LWLRLQDFCCALDKVTVSFVSGVSGGLDKQDRGAAGAEKRLGGLAEMTQGIKVKVFRFTPGEDSQGRFQEFAVETGEALSVMALLAKVHELDPGFACRTSTCFKGFCGSCLVRADGKDVFGCTTLIKPGEAVTIEPHSKFKIIRDVVVDFSQPLDSKASGV
jgi:succinate dehydrogenase / fumarate reductase, iron-sulfur subunit